MHASQNNNNNNKLRHVRDVKTRENKKKTPEEISL